MKKFILLIGLVALFGTTTAVAQTETIDLNAQGYANTQDMTTVSGTDVMLSFANNGGNTPPRYYNSGAAGGWGVRMYGTNSLTISSGKTITSVVLTIATGGSAPAANNFAVTPGTFDYSTLTWTGNSNEIVFTNILTSGNIRIASVAVTMQAPAGEVTPPMISGTTPFFGSTDVTLTAAEGTIYYTTDGTEPTMASTQYTAPFTLTADATVKAIAVDGTSKASAVATKDFAAIVDMPYTIADMNDPGLLDVNSNAIVEPFANLTLTDAQVVYVDGTNCYVREGDYAIMFYGTGLTFTVGDVINGSIIVEFDNYYGIPEVKDIAATTADGLTITAGTAAEPTIATIAELTGYSHVCDLVILQNVQITIDGTNTYATDGTNQIQLFKGTTDAYTALADNGQGYDIVGLLNNIYHSAAEIQPTTAPVPTGITNVITNEQTTDGRTYNLAGQQVNENTKGVVIKNGKKYINK